MQCRTAPHASQQRDSSETVARQQRDSSETARRHESPRVTANSGESDHEDGGGGEDRTRPDPRQPKSGRSRETIPDKSKTTTRLEPDKPRPKTREGDPDQDPMQRARRNQDGTRRQARRPRTSKTQDSGKTRHGYQAEDRSPGKAREDSPSRETALAQALENPPRVATSRYESPRASRHEPTQEPTKPQQATGYLHAATSPTSRHESP